MRWSYGIILSFVFFVVFILSLVYRTLHTEVDLVAEDYYAQEIAYQEVIDGKQNFQATGKKVSIVQTNDSLLITIPENTQEPFKGKLLIFRPSDQKLDREYTLNSGAFASSKGEYEIGQYVVKATWKEGDIDYYDEQPIFIQK